MKGKTITLYPGRYIFICPCGFPSSVMTISRVNKKIALYCFACKQEKGTYYKIMEQNLDFSYNWNNKLNGKYFTTIRLHNPLKYCVGNILKVTLKLQPRGRVKILRVKTMTIDQINDYIACLDTGYQAEECKKFLKGMYKNKGINWNTQVLDFCLLQYLDEGKEPKLF